MLTNESVSLTYYLIYWLVSGVAILVTSAIVPGFVVNGFITSMVASVVIGLVNAIIWPILIFLTLPINIITLGLFTFVVNGAVIKISAAVLPGFSVDGWFSAILGSIVFSIASTILHFIF